MNRISVVMLMMFFSSVLMAGSTPTVVAFEEGEQFNLSLSKLNFNRVFVPGEKIDQVSYPKGTFRVDLRDPKQPDSKDNSVYLKPLIDIPLTIFFSTVEGHHFSISVKPDDSFGKTLQFQAKHQKIAHWEKPSKIINNEVTELDQVMNTMISGEVPDGFKEAKVQGGSFYVQKNLKLSLVKSYRGETLTGYVYRVENRADHNVALKPSLFSHHHAQAIRLSDTELAPKQVAYLYGLYEAQG